MIGGEHYSKVAYILMISLTIIDCYVHISQLVMVFIMTGLIVYIGAVKSANVFSEEIQSENVETMKQKDAWLFPVIGSAVLIGLYMIFKYLNKDYINILFHVYFSFIGSDAIGAIISEKLTDIPYFKEASKKHLFTVPKIPIISESEVKVYLIDIYSFLIGCIPGSIYFLKKYWFMNNLIGTSFSIIGIQSLMLGEFKIGLILLVLLFFYDIIMVFYTPFMVGVAKNLDGPIKLMFPKVVNYSEKSDFNMIGLGDIVIPGIYVAFMLRFDMIKYFRKNKTFKGITMNFKDFPYFIITFFGYVLGIFVTLFIMVVFNHAQPALLYLVPGVLITSISRILINGDFKEIWDINEEKLQNELKGESNKDDKKSN